MGHGVPRQRLGYLAIAVGDARGPAMSVPPAPSLLGSVNVTCTPPIRDCRPVSVTVATRLVPKAVPTVVLCSLLVIVRFAGAARVGELWYRGVWVAAAADRNIDGAAAAAVVGSQCVDHLPITVGDAPWRRR